MSDLHKIAQSQSQLKIHYYILFLRKEKKIEKKLLLHAFVDIAKNIFETLGAFKYRVKIQNYLIINA